MADIELVIKIPEEIYQEAINSGYSHLYDEDVATAVADGIPLPKGHGDLIDRKKISSKRIRGITEFDRGYNIRSDEVDKDIANALVIVEADKESEDKDDKI